MNRNTPSREYCEKNIKRMLMSEVLEKGKNESFRTAKDFMPFFESLYPTSDALLKQVQRAVKALDMPKDEQGYFIAGKTVSQFEHEKEISSLFELAKVKTHPFEQIETIFLEVEPHLKTYLIHMLETSLTFKGKFLTLVETSNGVLIYTQNKNNLLILLNSLTIQD